MGFTDIFEPEELVGKFWDRLVGGKTSYPRHPEAAVRLEDMRAMLAVFFHGVGGDAGLEIAGAVARERHHRLTLMVKLGTANEKMETAKRDEQTLFMPNVIDLFPDRALNRKLYLWLAAYMALARGGVPDAVGEDPLRRDVMALAWHRITERRVLEALPGLRPIHAKLAAYILEHRPKRALPAMEQHVEECVLALLGGPEPKAKNPVWTFVGKEQGRLSDFKALLGYRPFLPVPLWGEVAEGGELPPARDLDDDLEDDDGGEDDTEVKDLRDGRKFSAERKDNDQAERDDPLAFDRFEHILAMAEMVNVNRPIDDDEDEDPMRAANDLDQITLSKNDRKTASKVRLDMDLPAGAVDDTRLRAQITYPEWDYRKKSYHPDHCAVHAGAVMDEGEDWKPDEATLKRIRKVRRQFEALRPKRERIPREFDGRELDVDALIRSRCDLAASGDGSDRIYVSFRNESRDLAALILVDVSLSTDAWMEGRRVLDVEKEALTTLTHGLAASGDDHAIFTFTSRKRNFVRLDQVKGFDEPLTPVVGRRIAALKPGYYTRMGAAIRFAADKLNERPNRHRLLLFISDGKPNDLDHYDGRYGIEDSRMAIREARQSGLAVFGVTIDAEARDYFPYMFGRGGCAIIPHIDRLTPALPNIYRHLVT
ncbi:MAG: VWA domain-containing protein [Alphaproteobacteria bacterium]|nr:VWA domain-containing protein [Alphaproteobacteria bacterium]MBF0250093.1 VWA domain-containing protein [Alphaproteobacteria bacterium]